MNIERVRRTAIGSLNTIRGVASLKRKFARHIGVSVCNICRN